MYVCKCINLWYARKSNVLYTQEIITLGVDSAHCLHDTQCLMKVC